MDLFNVVFLTKKGESIELSVLVAAKDSHDSIEEGRAYFARNGHADLQFINCTQVATKAYNKKGFQNFTIAE